jgi:predicted ATPase/class 3 adenylate cyclase
VTRTDLPLGTVTFLFTDVEGSTKLLHALGDAGYADALTEHRRVLREAFTRHGGVEVDTEGDAFFVAFPSPRGAVLAAADGTTALEDGPIKVRIGIHTGTPLRTDEGYVGVDVHRAARIGAAGHGGQVLISGVTAELLDGDTPFHLVDLGEHRLKDLAAPEPLFQLGPGPFPPLKTLSASNLPTPTTPFIGRADEVARLSALLTEPGTRLVTVTGPGGIGKTRLAIEAANASVDAFPGGRWWLALAPVRDPDMVTPVIARLLGVSEMVVGDRLLRAVGDAVGSRPTVLLLDNAEHLLPALAGDVARLLDAAPGLTILVTSRERLRIAPERLSDMDVMTDEDAQALFIARAEAIGAPIERGPAVAELCRRLDRLPLALQLAAARLRLFSVEQLLERMPVLDLSTGDRDADPRQRTIRATIEWSHDLLSEEERVLFRRLSVFVGGCGLDAAVLVASADVVTLEGLLDKALLQRRTQDGEPRFWMLESIREFAAERLEAAGETTEFRRRHAAWFRSLAAAADAAIRGGDPEEGHVDALDEVIADLWEAVSFGLGSGDRELVRSIVAALPMYWVMRGRLAEGRSWLERALEIDPTEDDLRRRLFSALATIAALQGDHVVAVEAADEAARLASEVGGATDRIEHLREQALAALLKNDFAAAEPLYEELLGVSIEVDNGVRTSACRLNLATIANHTEREPRAEALLRENLPFVRARGQSRCEATTLAMMAETSLRLGRAEDAREPARVAAVRSSQIGDDPLLIYSLELVAAAAAEQGDGRLAATILGATDAARERMQLEPDDDEALVRRLIQERLDPSSDGERAASAAGRQLDLDGALAAAVAD